MAVVDLSKLIDDIVVTMMDYDVLDSRDKDTQMAVSRKMLDRALVWVTTIRNEEAAGKVPDTSNYFSHDVGTFATKALDYVWVGNRFSQAAVDYTNFLGDIGIRIRKLGGH